MNSTTDSVSLIFTGAIALLVFLSVLWLVCWLCGFFDAERRGWKRLHYQEQKHGPNHPAVAETLNDLAVHCVRRREYSEADRLLKRALTIAEACTTPDNRGLQQIQSNLANLQHVRERESDHSAASAGCLLAIASFLLAPVGIIAGVILLTQNTPKAHAQALTCLRWAVAGLVVELVLWCLYAAEMLTLLVGLLSG